MGAELNHTNIHIQYSFYERSTPEDTVFSLIQLFGLDYQVVTHYILFGILHSPYLDIIHSVNWEPFGFRLWDHAWYLFNVIELKGRGKDLNLAVMPELLSDATYKGWFKQQSRLLLGASYPQLLRLVELLNPLT